MLHIMLLVSLDSNCMCCRFFYLSNDEMLEILSETKDPTRVQPHLKKCFEAVDTLTFTESLTITHLNSSQGESVPLVQPVDTVRARGSVERWLLEVESAMLTAVHASTEAGMVDYAASVRSAWVLKWPGMVVLAVAAVYWTEGVASALRKEGGGECGAVRAYETTCTCAPTCVLSLGECHVCTVFALVWLVYMSSSNIFLHAEDRG
jgi:dynein heavy chain, axonemal